uniref:Uncharacterized protein n=2 Tax=viral metagenome TaxID=1070528 RepID=A0A6M3KN41_9ZZZZ
MVTRAGTPMGTGANLGQVVEGSATCCPPIVLDRVERLVILRRRRGLTWMWCLRTLRERGVYLDPSSMYESLRPDWNAVRVGAQTREKILTALESVLTEEER